MKTIRKMVAQLSSLRPTIAYSRKVSWEPEATVTQYGKGSIDCQWISISHECVTTPMAVYSLHKVE
jgi:hypothetical protein